MGKRYNKNEVYDNRFYKIPKAFFKVNKYKEMSLNAKVVYGFLDDRRELSLKNNWIDKNGDIYLIYTREEVADMLCLSYKTAIKAFKELKKNELIEEVRQGINKPNLIYVCHLDLECADITWMCKKDISRHVNTTGQDMYKLQGNDTDCIEPDVSETEYIQGANKLSTPSLSYIDFVRKLLNGKRLQRKEAILDTIDYYFKVYKIVYGEEHIRYTEKKTKELVIKLEDIFVNGLDSDVHGTIDISEYEMRSMIEQHFKNDYSNSDHKLMAFVHNGVLLCRYYEIM